MSAARAQPLSETPSAQTEVMAGVHGSGPETAPGAPTLTRSSSAASLDSFKSVTTDKPTSGPSTGASTAPTSSAASFKGQARGPTRTPLTALSPDSKAPGTPQPNAEQELLYNEVLEAVSKWTSVPNTSAVGAARGDLTDDERMWLTRECLLRYLRATSWKVPDAVKRLEGTLTWRREYGANNFSADYISPELETGKQCIMGWDKQGRPVLYMSPAKQNTAMSDRQIHSMCYMIDRSIELLPPGQETIVELVSFKGTKMSQTPNMQQARDCLNIMQVHNPERLGLALISDLPWYVNAFMKIILPFVDAVTREKIIFQPKHSDYIPIEQLMQERTGNLEFEYDHKAYWPALTAEAARRRELYKERWRQGGSLIGESEFYLRGGSEKGIGASQKKQDVDGLAHATEQLSV